MIKLYYKYQWFYLLIAIGFFSFASFYFIQNKALENESILKAYKVVDQGCRSYKGGSSVHIIYKNKEYYIRLANKECTKYPVGSEILLNYNNKYDYFYKPDGLKRDINRVFFSGIAFILLLLPWKYIKRKISK